MPNGVSHMFVLTCQWQSQTSAVSDLNMQTYNPVVTLPCWVSRSSAYQISGNTATSDALIDQYFTIQQINPGDIIDDQIVLATKPILDFHGNTLYWVSSVGRKALTGPEWN